jgi:hypothetical protein
MADISDFHPFVQEALRTGKIPGDEDIARALGEEPDKITRLRERLEAESANSDIDASEPKLHNDDEERFRLRYRLLVDAMIADWHEDNPYAGQSIPDTERQRIEDYCRSQIQHQWKMHQQRLAEEQDT